MVPNRSYICVEGRDDAYVVRELLKQQGIDCHIEERGKATGTVIKPFEGKQHLLQSIKIVVESSEVKSVGIVIDADDNVAATYRSVLDRLSKLGAIENQHDKVWDLVLETGKRLKIGVWIMPDNNSDGAVEDFLRVISNDQGGLWQQVEHCFAAVQDKQLFTPAKKQKAKICTWLAWQEEPGLPYGQAIQRNYFDTNASVAKDFIQWVRSLVS